MYEQMIEERVINEADVFLAIKDSTIRHIAKSFGVSKTTVHRDLAIRLKKYDLILYNKVRYKLDCNKSERSIRGGLSYKRKYLIK